MKKKIFFAFMIIFLALSLRLYAAIKLPTDYDEPVYYTAARYYAKAIQTDHLESIPAAEFNYEHPTLAKLTYGAVLSMLPNDGYITGDVWQKFMFQKPLIQITDPFRLFLLRLVSVIFGTLAVALLALISPVAALALAVDSIAVKYTSVVYLEAMPIFLSLVSVFLFAEATKWIRVKETISLKDHWKESLLLLVSAICLGTAAACKYQYGIVGFAMLVFYVFWIIRYQPKEAKRYGILVGFFVMALAAFVLTDPYLYSNPIKNLSHSLAFSLDYKNGATVADAGYPFYQPLVWLSHSVQAFVNREVQPMPSRGNEFLFRLDTLIFIFAIIGLPKLFKDHPLYFLWLILGLLFLLAWNTKWPQYAMLVIVPLCLSSSQGIASIINLAKSRLIKTRKNTASI